MRLSTFIVVCIIGAGMAVAGVMGNNGLLAGMGAVIFTFTAIVVAFTGEK